MDQNTGFLLPILSFNTAVGGCSVAVTIGKDVLALEVSRVRYEHAERLFPMILSCLSSAGLTFGDLSALAVTVGPGSFSGLRVGLSSARALRIATGLPCLGINTVDVLAYEAVCKHAFLEEKICVALNSYRKDIYIAFFNKILDPIIPVKSILPKDLSSLFLKERVILVGDFQDSVISALCDHDVNIVSFKKIIFPCASYLGRLACHRLSLMSREEFSFLSAPLPLYLCPPDAQTSIELKKRTESLVFIK